MLIYSSRFLLSGFLLTLAPHTTQYLRLNRIHWQITGLEKKTAFFKNHWGLNKNTVYTSHTL